MIMKLRVLTFFFVLTLSLSATAQDEAPKGPWVRNASLGLDFAQLFQLNPRQGAGENRIGLGGAVNYGANYKKGRVAWDNLLLWQFGVQKLGAGPLPALPNSGSRPFQKSIDEFRFGSKVGYSIKENSKLYYAADLAVLSQVTPTYKDNFLSDFSAPGAGPISKFFAPGRVNLSIGIDYKPLDNLSIYYSPVGYQGLFVLDEDLSNAVVKNAASEISGSIFGNEIELSADKKTLISAKKSAHQVGSVLKGKYANKYFKDRVLFTSDLMLFSNYLNNPQNIDVNWMNEFGFNVYKGLSISVLANIFYDHDIFVQITDYDAPGGISGLGRRVSLTQQVLAKYNIVF
jgi:hypothetical protein